MNSTEIALQVIVKYQYNVGVVIYCGAYNRVIPKSSNDIIIQNNFVTSLSNIPSIVTVSELIPLTEYSFYCLARFGAIYSSFNNTLQKKINQRTSCCESVALTILKTNIDSFDTSMDTLSISIDYPPTNSLSIQILFIAVSNMSSSIGAPIVFPEMINVLNTTASRSIYMCTVSAIDISQFTVKIVISGSSYSE